MPHAATRVQLEILIQHEVCQIAKDKKRMISLTHGIETTARRSLTIEQKQTQTRRTERGCQGRGGGGGSGMEGEFGVRRCT